MKDKKVLFIGFIAVVTIICVINVLAPKGCKTIQKVPQEPEISYTDSLIIETERRFAFEKEIEEADYTEFIKEVLQEHFTTIDAITNTWKSYSMNFSAHSENKIQSRNVLNIDNQQLTS